MSAYGYLRFARANARFLGFGFVMTFASSVGQTFFIGVFGPVSFEISKWAVDAV